MPITGVTHYNILVSCPDDVLEYMPIIKESIEHINKVFATSYNIQLDIKHWSKDSYPESGEKPQDLLNQQLVKSCDAAIAIFWTRFGTPTSNFGSGTEEEIEEMLRSEKQVFLYFVDAKIEPSAIDSDQYKKVQDFKSRYRDKGIYFTVKNNQEFFKTLSQHLNLYYSQVMSKENDLTKNINEGPILKVVDINSLTEAKYFAYQTSLIESKCIYEKKDRIIKKLLLLQKNDIPQLESTLKQEPEKKTLSNLIMQLNHFPNNDLVTKIKIDDQIRKTINQFADNHFIALEDYFWNVGSLSKVNNKLNPLSFTLKGTDEEKKRYELLEELNYEITSYNECLDYFSYIDGLSFANLAITNIGKSYDEDIEVKLFIPKGFLTDFGDLKIPGVHLIEELLETNFINHVFSIQESDSIERYADYPPESKHYPVWDLLRSVNSEKRYEKNKEEFLSTLDKLFQYKNYQTDETDILILHIKYLKHNKSMAFPSVLFFEKNIPKIKYEVCSKHMPNKLIGYMEFEEFIENR